MSGTLDVSASTTRPYLAPADAAVEQIDLRWHLLEQRVERLIEDFEPGKIGIVQIDHHAGAFGLVDARLAHRLRERLAPVRRIGIGFAVAAPHGVTLAIAQGRAYRPRCGINKANTAATQTHARRGTTP